MNPTSSQSPLPPPWTKYHRLCWITPRPPNWCLLQPFPQSLFSTQQPKWCFQNVGKNPITLLQLSRGFLSHIEVNMIVLSMAPSTLSDLDSSPVSSPLSPHPSAPLSFFLPLPQMHWIALLPWSTGHPYTEPLHFHFLCLNTLLLDTLSLSLSLPPGLSSNGNISVTTSLSLNGQLQPTLLPSPIPILCSVFLHKTYHGIFCTSFVYYVSWSDPTH